MTSDFPDRLRLDPALDPAGLTGAFRRQGRLHLPGVLETGDAHALHRLLEAEEDWVSSTLSGDRAADLPVKALAASGPDKPRTLIEAAHAEAVRALDTPGRLHFLFDALRIDTALIDGQPLAAPWRAVHDFLNGAAFLDFIRALTGDPRVAYVDSRATRFLPGHYLTQHDDSRAGQDRLYAYVLNLTPEWKTDWGGLLAFIDEDGHVAEAYAPRMNALNLFAVPQAHAVTFVTPFARAPRYAITGWIRADTPAFPET